MVVGQVNKMLQRKRRLITKNAIVIAYGDTLDTAILNFRNFNLFVLDYCKLSMLFAAHRVKAEMQKHRIRPTRRPRKSIAFNSWLVTRWSILI